MSLKDRIQDNYEKRGSHSAVDRNYPINLPEGIDFFKAYYDKINKIIILPYIAGDKDPKVPEGEEAYCVEYYVHRSIGVNNDNYLCMKRMYGESCPICEEIEDLSGDYEKNKENIGKLRPSKRILYNILDYKSDNTEQIKLFDASFAFFEKEMLEEVVDPETNEIITFPDASAEGYYVNFRATEESFGQVKYPKYKSFRFEKRGFAIKKEILDKVFVLDSLFNIPKYEDVKNAFLGVSGETDEEKYYNEISKNNKKEEREVKKETNSTKCPHNHIFKKDCDMWDECIQCDIWEECSEK